MAKELLGKYFIRHTNGTRFVGRIVETEAYRGKLDPAAHTYRGRTKRNEVMYRGGGHLYVYFTYGMHFCANVVTGQAGSGEAVLIRALEPLEGIDSMVENRFRIHRKRTKPEVAQHNVTNGPAKLCEALSIRREQNGTDLLGDEIYLLEGPQVAVSEIARSTRIGITNGREKKWRFAIKGNRWVSR